MGAGLSSSDSTATKNDQSVGVTNTGPTLSFAENNGSGGAPWLGPEPLPALPSLTGSTWTAWIVPGLLIAAFVGILVWAVRKKGS